jgi:hypothetical protein
MNVPGGVGLGRLVQVARDACARSGRDPERFLVTTSASPSKAKHQRLADAGVDRVILYVRPPYVDGDANRPAGAPGLGN